MKYYAAVGSEHDIQAATVMPPNNILCSYHYFKKKPDLIKECLAKHFDVFIDSGAFSANTKGVNINIDEYCMFLKDTGVTTYAGLDVIGDAKATKENIEYMIREFDLDPIPTFHLGSNIDDLKEMVDNYPYIALGGLVWTAGVRSHLNQVWHYIQTHNPKLRVHGFGTTNIELIREYPWYSVDSSSYKFCKRFGLQYLAWDSLDLTSMREVEYLELLEKMGYKGVKDYEKKDKYFLYDFHSCQAYKNYVAMVTELNKHRKFDFLTAQQLLF